MDMSHYRELFLSETREHINNLNTLIVALEQNTGHRETIDALFREAHSIKGMAATMGFDRTAQLSHHLEDLLGGFRSSGVVPSSTIDYLLTGIDILDGLLADLQANQPEREIASFLSSRPLDQFVPGESEPAAEPATGRDETDESYQELTPLDLLEPDGELEVAAVAGHQEVYAEDIAVLQVIVDLAEGTPALAARGLLLLRELEKHGQLISSKPDTRDLRGGAPYRQIQAWLRTSRGKAEVEEAMRQISGVEQVRFVDDRRKESPQMQEDGVRTVRVKTDLLDHFVNLTGELITHRHLLKTAVNRHDWNELNQTLNQTSRLIDDLHHQVLQSRLMPLEHITGRLPRIVRDLSRQIDKTVSLRLIGADVGIDRAVLEELTDPLVHLVRNAVDHGIEKEGTVTVSARREKDLVLVEVADDGRGMSPELLRQRAVERGLMPAHQASNLSDRNALMLICQPGFSTRDQVTEISGRGVGMDIVKSAVDSLGGTLEILSEAGKGTRVQMRLPLSVAIIKILLVSCAGHALAIPITRVQRTLDLPTREIQSSGQQRVFRLADEIISIYSLAEALGLPKSPAGETTWLVLTEMQGRKIGLQVDLFLGQRESFVKSIGFPLNLLPGLSGATVAGDGRVVFIVDPQALLEKQQLSHPMDPGGFDALS